MLAVASWDMTDDEIWALSRGGHDPSKVYAAYKFFLYTLLGSVLMLAAILLMASIAKTTSIPELMNYKFAPGLQIWLWLAFFFKTTCR